jgi:N4-gp56 family major capsid protein
MATTNYGVNNPLAVKLWAKKLNVEALKATWVSKFISEGTDGVIQRKTDMEKSAGDRLTIGLRMQMTGAGIQGDGTLEGNEEALVTYSDNLLINQLRHATRSAGKMSEQRVPFSVRSEGMAGLRDWLADRYDASFFNQVCGFTTQADTRYTGNNSTIAPDTAHLLIAGGVGAAEASLSATTTAYLSLTDIDKAVTTAKSFGVYGDYTTSVPMRPIMVGGEQKYVLFMHPYQTMRLRTNTSTGQWLDIQKAAMTGGQVTNNPIYTGALGEYNGVVLHESARVTPTVAFAGGTNTIGAQSSYYRAVLCGAQAAAIGFGQDQNTGLSGSWVEELFDYGNQLGIAAGMIFGLKKLQYNSRDFATLVISSYAPPPTT